MAYTLINLIDFVVADNNTFQAIILRPLYDRRRKTNLLYYIQPSHLRLYTRHRHHRRQHQPIMRPSVEHGP